MGPAPTGKRRLVTAHTLIGRLLAETGSLPDGKLEQLKAVSARRGMPFELSFLLDALQTERDQGITIDTSQIRFRTPARDFVLIDAPGHTEFLRNMITGASQAHAAVLIVDAAEGVREQTLRHGYLPASARRAPGRGRRQQDGPRRLRRRPVPRHRRRDQRPPRRLRGQAHRGDPDFRAPRRRRRRPHRGDRRGCLGLTVIEALDQFLPAQPATALPLRLPVQAVYKFDDRRIVAGRIESGMIAVGDEIAVAPSGKRARVRSIEAWPAADASGGTAAASAGRSVGITLDRELFIGRGDVIAAAAARAPTAQRLEARIFWLHDEPLAAGAIVTVRVGTAEGRGTIVAIENSVDPGEVAAAHAETVGQNHVGDIEIALAAPLAVDLYEDNPRTGRVVLDHGGRIAGGGLVLSLPGDANKTDAPAEAVALADPRFRPRRHACEASM